MADFRLTRLGCLAVHLMPEYHGRKLENAVARIANSGPRTKYEQDAVRKANENECEGKLLPTDIQVNRR